MALPLVFLLNHKKKLLLQGFHLLGPVFQKVNVWDEIRNLIVYLGKKLTFTHKNNLRITEISFPYIKGKI